MKCLVGMSKVNAPCNSIVEILWCGSAAAKAHVCVRTYVMTASASADLKELPLLRSSFDMIQKYFCCFNYSVEAYTIDLRRCLEHLKQTFFNIFGRMVKVILPQLKHIEALLYKLICNVINLAKHPTLMINCHS